jgi:integrase
VVQPSGVRSWAVRYRHGGKSRKLTLGPYPALDLATARARARDALQAVPLGRDPASEKKAALKGARDAELVADAVTDVVETFLARHARAKTKARTAHEIERTFQRYVLPKWGERRIQDISRRDVIELLDGLMDRGIPIAANRTLGAIKRLFNWAIDRSIVDTSPCLRLVPPAEEKSRDRVLSDEELRLAWLAAERMGAPFGAFVQALMLSAQRRDEVAGMRWPELKEGEALWTLPGQRTKNSVEHDVPLCSDIREIVARLPRIARSEFIFTTTCQAPISGFSKAKARLDALMLEIARQEATETAETRAR